MLKQIFKILFLIVISLSFGSCKKSNTVSSEYTPAYRLDDSVSASIKVGVYLDYGVFDGCKTNTVNMLNEMHCNYTVLNKDSIMNGALNHYQLLIMPGGDMWQYSSYLAPTGMTMIRNYVSQGGGYIGICGGAYFSANKIVWHGWAGQPRENISIPGLNIIPVTAEGPIEDYAPTYVDSKCQIKVVQPSNPIFAGLPGIIAPYYDHGPMFIVSDSINISILGRTVAGDKKIILSYQYNLGKVFLTGAHPEADNSRTSWLMVKNAIKWCTGK
jgi:glutamine amidotransferase-like uncharacterized protein